MTGAAVRDDMNLNEALLRLSDRKKPGGDLSSEKSSSQSWDLNTTFSQARDLARYGWQEKAAEIWKKVQALAAETEYGITTSYDVAGDAVDVGRLLSGEPECMFSHEVRTKNVVRVVVNISARCTAPAELLLNRGVAIAAVIHALQSSGRGVALTVTDCVTPSNYGGSDKHETAIEIGRSGDYLNVSRLAFWLAHPAALRRCMFRYNEQQPSGVRNKWGFEDGSGYGVPVDNTEEYMGQDVVYIPFPETYTLSHYEDPRKALAQVIERFKEKGIPITVRGA